MLEYLLDDILEDLRVCVGNSFFGCNRDNSKNYRCEEFQCVMSCCVYALTTRLRTS